MKVAGVILASGRSSRMGTDKADLVIDGERNVDRLRRVYREVLDPVVVVGHDIRGAMDGEMIDSLACGIDAVLDADAAVVQPIDAPFTTAEHLRLLIDGFDGRARVLAHDGTPGHPVILPKALFDAIRARPDGGLRTLLTGAELVEADETVLADLDTREDLVKWKVSG